jgi:hypothetical protein
VLHYAAKKRETLGLTLSVHQCDIHERLAAAKGCGALPP